MTPEEKYDKALEKARELISRCKDNRDRKTMIYRVEDIESIFPELKESEDEKIRKEIIAFLKENLETGRADETWSLSGLERWIAWLEKQGEKKPAKSIVEIWKDMRFEVYQQASGNRHEPNCSDDTTKMFSLNDIDEIIEKISEHKLVGDFKAKDWYVSKVDGKIHNIYHTDKVEPKFHKGEWLCENKPNNYARFIQILEIINEQGKYRISRDIHNDEDIVEFDFLKKYYHEFDINDAKEGDVLWHSDTASNGIFIFKEIRHNGKILCYCDYDSEDHFCTGEYHTCCWSSDKYIKPATKEQRKLLFSKMKEAGWEWDANKKEFKEINL